MASLNAVGVYKRPYGFMVSESTVSNLKYLAIEFVEQDQAEPALTIDDLLLGMPTGNTNQQPLLSGYDLQLISY